MLTAEVLGNLSGGELRFADVPKVPGQVDRFTCLKKREKISFLANFGHLAAESERLDGRSQQ